MLLDDYIEISVTGHNKDYYIQKGYKVPTYSDRGRERVKKGTKIVVKTTDLHPGSTTKVNVKCDNCGAEKLTSYANYMKSVSCGTDGKYYCKKCNSIHNKQTAKERYGVESIAQLDSVKEKRKRTNLERYGTEYAVGNPEIAQKIRETNMKKYGVGCVLELPEHQQAKKKGSLKKYGTEYPTQSQAFWEEVKELNLKKYGTEWSIASPEVREKINNSFAQNGTMKSSKQQRHINNLYNGQLNYPISKFFVDIFIEKDNCCVEYDGGGHNLNVVTGRWTQEEYNRREIIREATIKRNGYRLIRIVCPQDFLPSDSVLLQMKSDALSYFESTNHTWRTYYVEDGTFEDAEHREKPSYDYGELNRIDKIKSA